MIKCYVRTSSPGKAEGLARDVSWTSPTAEECPRYPHSPDDGLYQVTITARLVRPKRKADRPAPAAPSQELELAEKWLRDGTQCPEENGACKECREYAAVIAAELDRLRARLVATQASADGWREKYTTYCQCYHDAAKERDDLRAGNARLLAKKNARPASEYHEDFGDVLWWRFPIQEPPWCGSPLDEDFEEGYYTHWTTIDVPDEDRAAKPADGGEETT